MYKFVHSGWTYTLTLTCCEHLCSVLSILHHQVSWKMYFHSFVSRCRHQSLCLYAGGYTHTLPLFLKTRAVSLNPYWHTITKWLSIPFLGVFYIHASIYIYLSSIALTWQLLSAHRPPAHRNKSPFYSTAGGPLIPLPAEGLLENAQLHLFSPRYKAGIMFCVISINSQLWTLWFI